MRNCIDINEISSEHLMDYEQELEYCRLIIHLLVRKQGFGDSAYECVEDDLSGIITGDCTDFDSVLKASRIDTLLEGKLRKIMNECEDRVYYFGSEED